MIRYINLIIILAEACNIADIAFVLDSSGSIGRSDWAIALEFVISLVNKLEIGPTGVQVGVVTYGNTATVNFDLNEYNDTTTLINNIRAIEYKDANTNTSGGIYVMKEKIFNQKNGDRPEAPNLGTNLLSYENSNKNDDANLLYTKNKS